MLGRTASSLFWMSRYIERAENMARLAEVGFRIALTPDASAGHQEDWRSMLTSAGVIDDYLERHGEISQEAALDFLLFDPDNPSSVRACIRAARTNARTVRTSITRDMWEAMNTTYLAFEAIKPDEISDARLPEFLDWVRERTSHFRGALLNTILRNDTFYFSQIGGFIERADNTARILDVKYYLLLPSNQAVGGDIDTYQWETILRSVSAHRSYRHVFHARYQPLYVAEFLILRPEMPRSLRFCYDWLAELMDGLCDYYGACGSTKPLVEAMRTQLMTTKMETIIKSGLHEFLLDFRGRNNALTTAISDDYNFC